MASSSGYVVKVSGKRAGGDAAETLYVDLGRLILATDDGKGIAIVLEGGEKVALTGDDADWVRELLDQMSQPRKGQRGNVLMGGQR